MLITTSDSSKEARDHVNRIEKRIALIDGENPAKLTIERGVGITDVAAYTIKKVESHYFHE